MDVKLVLSFWRKTEHRLKIFANKMNRRTFGSTREDGKNYIRRSFIIYSLLQILLGRTNFGR
jgi:hypothetical protein